MRYKDDEQFNDEKAFLIKQIYALDPDHVPSKGTSAENSQEFRPSKTD
jgi:hypothetical protein